MLVRACTEEDIVQLDILTNPHYRYHIQVFESGPKVVENTIPLTDNVSMKRCRRKKCCRGGPSSRILQTPLN